MADDTYLGIWRAADSLSLRNRVTACATRENVPDNPEAWAFNNRWEYAAAPGWGAAFDSAEAGGNPDPGADPTVVTDGMILTQIQAMLAEEVTP